MHCFRSLSTNEAMRHPALRRWASFFSTCAEAYAKQSRVRYESPPTVDDGHEAMSPLARDWLTGQVTRGGPSLEQALWRQELKIPEEPLKPGEQTVDEDDDIEVLLAVTMAVNEAMGGANGLRLKQAARQSAAHVASSKHHVPVTSQGAGVAVPAGTVGTASTAGASATVGGAGAGATVAAGGAASAVGAVGPPRAAGAVATAGAAGALGPAVAEVAVVAAATAGAPATVGGAGTGATAVAGGAASAAGAAGSPSASGAAGAAGALDPAVLVVAAATAGTPDMIGAAGAAAVVVGATGAAASAPRVGQAGTAGLALRPGVTYTKLKLLLVNLGGSMSNMEAVIHGAEKTGVHVVVAMEAGPPGDPQVPSPPWASWVQHGFYSETKPGGYHGGLPDRRVASGSGVGLRGSPWPGTAAHLACPHGADPSVCREPAPTLHCGWLLWYGVEPWRAGLPVLPEPHSPSHP